MGILWAHMGAIGCIVLTFLYLHAVMQFFLKEYVQVHLLVPIKLRSCILLDITMMTSPTNYDGTQLHIRRCRNVNRTGGLTIPNG